MEERGPSNTQAVDPISFPEISRDQSNILNYTSNQFLNQDNSQSLEGIDPNLLRNYLAMGKFDVTFDNYNVENTDPDFIHPSRYFKETIHILIRQFEQSQSNQNFSSRSTQYTQSTENTQLITDD